MTGWRHALVRLRAIDWRPAAALLVALAAAALLAGALLWALMPLLLGLYLVLLLRDGLAALAYVLHALAGGGGAA